MNKQNNALQNKIIEIAAKHELSTILNEARTVENQQLKTKVAFLGEFSSGKTSLVNALIKKKFLPMFDKPTTAIITEIVSGDTNKLEILEDRDGITETKEISMGDIAKEVQKQGAGRKLIVTLSGSEVIDEKTILIDTPGVSSINETHTDITYGYLEYVDVAFVVVNVNTGSASKSLIEFLEKVPKDVLSKIYFILNFSDTKSRNQIAKLKLEFKNSLSELIDEPTIYLTSAKKALQANDTGDECLFNESGLDSVLKIITKEIPGFHKEIEEKRKLEVLNHLKDNIEKSLSDMINYLDYNEEEYFLELENVKANIHELELRKRKFRDELGKLEKDTRLELRQIADDYTAGIIHRMNEDEDFSQDIALMAIEIENILKSKLENIENFQMQDINEGFAQNVAVSLKHRFGKIFSITNKVPGILNSAIIAVATGGTGLAINTAEFLITKGLGVGIEYAEKQQNKKDTAAVAQEISTPSSEKKLTSSSIAASETSTSNAKGNSDTSVSSKKNTGTYFKKGVLILSSALAELNVVGEIKDMAMKKIMYNRINRIIQNKIDSQCTYVFISVNKIFNKEILSNFELPLISEKESLASIRKNRELEKSKLDQEKENIKKDLLELKVL